MIPWWLPVAAWAVLVSAIFGAKERAATAQVGDHHHRSGPTSVRETEAIQYPNRVCK